MHCLFKKSKSQATTNILLGTYIFQTPLDKIYTVDNEPLRHVIQRRLTFVYNLLFFLEESLIRLENEIQLDLEKAILNTIQMLRNAKLFPTIDTLSNSSVEVEKQIGKILKMILKNKMLNICNLIEFESSHAAYFNPCKCQLKLITEVETWRRKYRRLNSIKMISFPNSLCFECIDKNECHHIQPLA